MWDVDSRDRLWTHENIFRWHTGTTAAIFRRYTRLRQNKLKIIVYSLSPLITKISTLAQHNANKKLPSFCTIFKAIFFLNLGRFLWNTLYVIGTTPTLTVMSFNEPFVIQKDDKVEQEFWHFSLLLRSRSRNLSDRHRPPKVAAAPPHRRGRTN